MTKLKNWFMSLWNRLLNKTTIDERITDTLQEARELSETIEEVMEQAKDVFEAANGTLIEGKVTKSKLREMKKADLLKYATKVFDVNLDSTLTKTNIVNKVYELHNGISKGSGAKSSGSGAGKGKSTKKGKGAKSSGSGAGKKATTRKGAGKSKK
jgi:ribosomal protein L17